MTTLTAKQRLLVYEALLKEVCKDPLVEYGMCYYLINLLDESKEMHDDWAYMGGCYKMTHLPELNEYKEFYRELYFPFWAPRTITGWETRIRWIEQAIIDVKKKIK